jgi:hypothetical protein
MCLCDCGKNTIVSRRNLRQTRGTKSCGCLVREACKVAGKANAGIPGESAFNKMYQGYIDWDKRKGRDFSLTEEEFKDITQQDCFYCGSPPIGEYGHYHFIAKYIGNGVDRIDSTKGHIISTKFSFPLPPALYSLAKSSINCEFSAGLLTRFW